MEESSTSKATTTINLNKSPSANWHLVLRQTIIQMEKKQSSRTNQVPAKVLSSESRKSNQGKLFIHSIFYFLPFVSVFRHNAPLELSVFDRSIYDKFGTDVAHAHCIKILKLS